MLYPLTIEEAKALPSDTKVYLESQADPYLFPNYPIQMEHGEYNAYFRDYKKSKLYTKDFADYGLNAMKNGWRIWPERPTIEELFNAGSF